MKSLRTLFVCSMVLLASCQKSPVEQKSVDAQKAELSNDGLAKTTSADCPSDEASIDITSFTPSNLTVCVPAGQNYNMSYNIQATASIDPSQGEGPVIGFYVDGVYQNISPNWSACSGPFQSYCYNYNGTKSLGAGTHSLLVRAYISTICNGAGYNGALRRDSYSTTITVTNQVPATPTLSGSVVNNHPHLSWTQSASATGYKIYKSYSLTGSFSVVNTINSGSTTSWTDNDDVIFGGVGLKGYRRYKVQAFNSCDVSGFSNIAQFTVVND